jgi:PAS domain-containing protein
MSAALIISLLSVEAIILVFQKIKSVLLGDLAPTPEQFDAIQQLIIQLSIGLVLIIMLIFFILLMDTNRLVYRINLIIREALGERKLEEHFTNLSSAKNYDELRKNINSVLSLFKSFDMMKANRIALETSSIKSLMNNISEGVLLVNKEKVVTHINHRGEQILRLIPGEIIGTAASRKISHDVFLAKLDDAIQNNQIITDQYIQIRENHPLKLNLFPIKNKFGEVIRALVIIHPQVEQLDLAAAQSLAENTPLPAAVSQEVFEKEEKKESKTIKGDAKKASKSTPKGSKKSTEKNSQSTKKSDKSSTKGSKNSAEKSNEKTSKKSDEKR